MRDHHVGEAGLGRTLGEVKICQHEVPRGVQENIFWLQVAVNKALHVNVLEGEEDLRGVVLCMGF